METALPPVAIKIILLFFIPLVQDENIMQSMHMFDNVI